MTSDNIVDYIFPKERDVTTGVTGITTVAPKFLVKYLNLILTCELAAVGADSVHHRQRRTKNFSVDTPLKSINF